MVGSVVIDAEFSRDDHGSISRNRIGRGLEPLDSKIDIQTRLDGPVGQILIGETKKNVGFPKPKYSA
jgi:hypothetical protein